MTNDRKAQQAIHIEDSVAATRHPYLHEDMFYIRG